MPASEAVARALKARIDPSQLSLSSDANASLPEFDDQRRFVGLKPGRLSSLFDVLGECVNDHQIRMEHALQCATTTAADALKLPQKGRLIPGSDADFIVLSEGRWAIDHVWALGKPIFSAP